MSGFDYRADAEHQMLAADEQGMLATARSISSNYRELFAQETGWIGRNIVHGHRREEVRGLDYVRQQSTSRVIAIVSVTVPKLRNMCTHLTFTSGKGRTGSCVTWFLDVYVEGL